MPRTCVCPCCREKRVIRGRVDDVLDILVPTKESERARESIVTWVRKRIVKDACPQAKIRVAGSYALKTYLPDADVDLIVTTTGVNGGGTGSGGDGGAEKEEEEEVLVRLCGRACAAARRGRRRRRHSTPSSTPNTHTERHDVRNVFFVNGEIPVLRIAIDNVYVDVVSEKTTSLDAFDYFEALDARIGSSHLFKRSLLLVKAWCRYEKDSVGGAREGGLATHAINAMVAEIFREFGAYVKHPLDVFAHFVERYGEICDMGSPPRCARVNDPLDASRNCARALSSSKASAFASSLERIRNDVRSVVTFEPCSGGGGGSGASSGSGRKRKKKKKRVLDVTQKLRLLDEQIFPGTWAALTRRRRQRSSSNSDSSSGSSNGPVADTEEWGKGDGTSAPGRTLMSVPWRPDLLKHPLQRFVSEERGRTRSPLTVLTGRSEVGGGTDGVVVVATQRRGLPPAGVGRALLGVAIGVAVVAAVVAMRMMMVTTPSLSPPMTTSSLPPPTTTIDVTEASTSAPPPPPPPITTTVWIPHAVAVGLETSGTSMRLVRGNFRVVAGPGVTVRNLPPPPSRRRENDRRDESRVRFVRTALDERATLRASEEGRRADDALTTYRWFRNGLPLFDEGDTERRELVVDPVTPRDLGTYSCRVSNPLWGGGEDEVREWVVMVA